MTTNTADSSLPSASTPAFPQVDNAIADLLAGEKKWATLTLADRRGLLQRTAELAGKHAEKWVTAALTIKGLSTDSPLAGEEWLAGPYPVISSAQALMESLSQLEKGSSPLADATFGTAPGGRTTVKILPLNIFDSLLLSGFSGDVWLQPGVDAESARRNAGLAQLEPSATGGIGVVLGAGNISSIAPLDALYELYANNRVVALKLNPITDPLHDVFTAVLAPFIEVGAVRILTGGADVGTYLVHHDDVAHVHMTGSAITHDVIVYGPGDEGAARKAADTPLLDKPMTSELGGVSPTIVFPGTWSKADIDFQAEHVATQRLHNSGYNCVASQVVVVSSEWPQKDEFLDAVRKYLDKAPARPAYYPGSDTRVKSAIASYPDAERRGPGGGRVFVTGLQPDQYAPLLQTEYFSPVLGVIELPYSGMEFVKKAVQTVNDDFVGTLGVNIIAHPKTLSGMGSDLDTVIESLRYGTVAINAWTALAYLSARATWGAFPGHTRNDVQSGIGVVHNGFLMADTERSVVRGPFRPSPRSFAAGEMSMSPKPPWFVTNKTGAKTGRLLTEFADSPSWAKMPALFASALRG